MYIANDIAYAGDQTQPIKISGVRPMKEHKLWLRFSTGEAKVFDFKPLLSQKGFESLADPEAFAGVYIDYGVTVWNDGEIDIAPEYLYEHSVAADVSNSNIA